MKVTELNGVVHAAYDKREEFIEKFNGRFNLLINESLPVNK